MKIATVPDSKPYLTGHGKFVPRVANITFTHEEHGEVIVSVQDNDMNDCIMRSHNLDNSMEVVTEKDVKSTIRNIRKKYPEAIVETNHKPWS